MAITINKPGTTAEVLDGKLAPRVTLPTDVVLVIDRATSGESESLYMVSDSNTAQLIYGANSPIITGMRHALAGGAQNVALYRIGGGASTINNLFGQYTLLSTVSQAVGADSALSVYAGPRPGSPSTYCIIVFKGSTIVYSNVPGSSIDAKVVNVDGFDQTSFPYVIGTPSAPVPFADVIANIQGSGSQTIALTSAGQTAIVFPTPLTAAPTSVTYTSGAVTTTLVAGTDYTLTGTAPSITGLTLTASTGLIGDAVDVTGLAILTAPQLAVAGITYVPAFDSMNANLNKLYELYDTAFINLDGFTVFAAAIAVVILGESLSLYKIIAAIFIFAGVYLATKTNSNA